MVTLSSLRQLVETQQGTTGLDSAQVSAISGSGVSVYETLDSLPSTGLTAGDEAFVKGNSRLYISNGPGWYNTTLVNRTPRWDSGGEPDASYTIADSQTPLTITARAIDSDNGNLINQSVVTDSAQYMVDITNDSSVWTFTPKSADSIGIEVAAGNLTDSDGDFVYTFKWSDGVSFVSKAVTIAYNVTGGGGAGFSALSEQAANGGTPRSYTSSVTGDVFHYSGLSPSANNYYSQIELTTTPGGVFYIAMIGAGGGNGRGSSGNGGAGGLGVAKITVPNGVTSMTIVSGAGGLSEASTSATSGGLLGGGNGGIGSNSTYAYSTSGGGYTGLFTGTSASFANAVAIVGAGGAGGNWSGGVEDYGGHGGAFNNNGSDGTTDAEAGLQGSGGTTSAGGAGSTESRSYSSSNAQDGSQLQGGNGSGSNYDAGGGGGGGYYGGGGGGGGGGYDGGPGGGGSGYLDLNYGIIMHNNDTYSTSGGSELNIDGSNFNTSYLTQYVRTVSGATDFTTSNTGISTGHGQGGNTSVRQHGQFVIWNAPAS